MNRVGNKEAGGKDFEVGFNWNVIGNKFKDTAPNDFKVVLSFKGITTGENFNLLNFDKIVNTKF